MTLAATAGPGSFFQGWSGSCSGTSACQVTLSDHSFVNAQFGHANVPPSITLTAPAAGTVLSPPPATTPITAAATDPDGTVARVEFFAGMVKIGESVAPPYGVTWSPSAPGPYLLTARVTDDDGAAVDSPPVSVTVAANLPPTVTVTSPAPDSILVTPATITLAANASDPDGTVVRVEFFEGEVSRGFDTTSPYSVVWSNVAAGSHALTAVATDDRGVTSTVPFTVNVAVRVAVQADAYVRDGEPRENFGRENVLQVRKASGSSKTRWTYLRFSVSAVSAVSRARLRLFGGLTDEGATSVHTLVFPVASTTWNESSITWNNKPAAGATVLAAAPLDVSTTAQRWYEWDLTTYVQAQKEAGRNVISIAIKNDVVTSAKASFRSREANQNRPELLLTP